MPHFLHRLPANGWAFALVILLLVAPCGALAADLFGRVVGISDGDTLTMLTPQRNEVRIRLADIDTPERRQPYGTRARETLSALVFGRSVRVMVQDTDRYGRSVGRIFVGTQDVSAEMVRLGAAWVFRRYSQDPNLLQLEAVARAQRRGLWALPEADRLPPWEWRAAERAR